MRDKPGKNDYAVYYSELQRRLGRYQSIILSSPNTYIAYSGGIDSHVLLHLCASCKPLEGKLTAFHINHGLQADAENWSKHAEQVCAGLGVKFISLKVNAHPEPGQSPEEAARNARYAALEPLLHENDVLMLAQHREDQLETFLLQLFRGSGLKGLSAMPEKAQFGKGYLLRPLLEIPKAELLRYAQAHHLCWIDDPTNRESRFDRNFLRNEVLPLLKQRWPSLDKTVARSAGQCAEAQEIITDLSADLLKQVMNNDKSLNISLLKSYPEGYQALIIRQWLTTLNLKMPSQRIVQRVLKEVAAAREDADPVLDIQGHEIRRYRDQLFCLKIITKPLTHLPFRWPTDQSALTITDDLVYDLIPSDQGILVDQWRNSTVEVRGRQGGEKIRLPGRAGSHCLKKLFQEAGVPPWLRSSIPLIYLNNELAAVGNLWISASFYRESANGCFRLVRRESTAKGNDGNANLD